MNARQRRRAQREVNASMVRQGWKRCGRGWSKVERYPIGERRVEFVPDRATQTSTTGSWQIGRPA